MRIQTNVFIFLLSDLNENKQKNFWKVEKSGREWLTCIFSYGIMDSS